MVSYTLDWNCVVAVENNEPQRAAVLKLAELHRAGLADAALTAVSASENLRGSRLFPGDANQFSRRVSAAGLGHLTVLLAPGTIDLTYFDMSYWRDENDQVDGLVSRIWSIIGGNVPMDLPADVTAENLHGPMMSKWRNVWCDVHTLLVHLENQRDIFVTANTADFQKHSSALGQLGLVSISLPSECV